MFFRNYVLPKCSVTEAEIFYNINVYRHDNGDHWIWGASNLHQSEAVFNFDGSATENIRKDHSYQMEVKATDASGNEGYYDVRFSVGEYLTIENNLLSIDFYPLKPYVNRYTFKNSGEEMYGDIRDETFLVDIFYNGNIYNVIPVVESIDKQISWICYHLGADVESNHAVKFDLLYILDEETVKIIFENVTESEGYKLILVRSPDIITVRSIQEGAKLVFPHFEGRLVDIASANQGFEHVIYGDWSRPLLTSMLYHDKLACVVNYDHLDINLWARVGEHSSEGKVAAIGIDFNYRYAPTDFTNATFIDVFDSETTSLSVTCNFLDDYDNDKDNDWMDGAKYIRDQVQTTPEPLYLKSFMTKICVRGYENPMDLLTPIRKLYHLTDHNNIHTYMDNYSRWVFSLFGVAEDLKPGWAYDELSHVFKEAEESYNIFLGFHDNYRDYIVGSPGYHPDLRVIRADGTPSPGWPVPPFQLYITDPYDYAIQEGLDRVSRTVARYSIKESHHIDVLNLSIPLDYSVNSPSSRERNRRGLQLIIDEFDKAGIDVTTEGITGPFVESGIGWFLWVPKQRAWSLSFDNEKEIPLIEFMYHGKTLFGLPEHLDPSKGKYTHLEPILLGTSSGAHITCTGEDDLEIDKFYLIDLPWMSLNQRFMENYEEKGGYRKITYDEDTYVEIDYEANSYTVQVDGRIIGKDYTTIYPKSDSTFLIYSQDEKEISLELPDSWEQELVLLELTETGPLGNVPFTISGGHLVFRAKADTPYKLIKSSLTNVNESNNSNSGVVQTYRLLQNYPNPFNLITTIKYHIPKVGKVSVMVYDINGRLIDILVNEHQKSGVYSVKWDASKVSSGVYFYKIKVGKFKDVKKAIFLK